MKERTAIIAALPREVNALVKGWERREVGQRVFVWTNGSTVVACAGIGAARAALACEAAMKAAPVTLLISAGLAGACDAKLHVGDVVRAGAVIDSRTGERFGGAGEGAEFVVTGERIAGVREKARLRASYGASAVDMEAAAVARIALAHGLGFRAIKAISDKAEFAMEGLERFVTAEGQFREGAFALHAAMRPWMWSKVIALGRNSGKAVEVLTEALQAELD